MMNFLLERIKLKDGVRKGKGQLVLQSEIEKSYIPILDYWYISHCEESAYKIPHKDIGSKIIPIIQIA
jgi:hypothetical protein